MDYIQEIGKTAGTIWKYLNDNGPSTPQELASSNKINRFLMNRAIGWLAREGKIKIEKTNRTFKISLLS